MALTGFNPDLVNQSIGSIKTAYESLIQSLGNDMQTNFVGGMADKWACAEAQKFFNDALKPSVDALLTSSDSVFASVVDAMNSAARSWAESTGTSYSPVSFAPRNFKIDVSSIVENIGGVRGIDYENAKSVVQKLSPIAISAESALTSAQNAVSNCGFLGGGQADQLQSSLKMIKDKISAATNEITNQTTTALNATIDRYGDLAGQVSQAFTANS